MMNFRFWERLKKELKKDQLPTVHSVFLTNIGLKIKTGEEASKWKACGLGAMKLLGDLQWLSEFEVPDTLNKARLCFELGMQPMLTVWHYEMNSRLTEEEIRADYNRVQDLIDDLRFTLSKDTVDLYVKFHRELTGYLTSLVYPRDNYMGMFHLRYRECVSTDRIINLKVLGAHVETWQMFMEDCRGYCDMMLTTQGVEEFFGIFNEATSHMLRKYEQIKASSTINAPASPQSH